MSWERSEKALLRWILIFKNTFSYFQALKSRYSLGENSNFRATAVIPGWTSWEEAKLLLLMELLRSNSKVSDSSNLLALKGFLFLPHLSVMFPESEHSSLSFYVISRPEPLFLSLQHFNLQKKEKKETYLTIKYRIF